MPTRIWINAHLHSTLSLAGTNEDVIDADYIVVAPEQRAQPEQQAALRPAITGFGMDMLSKSAAEYSQATPDRGSPLFWVGGLALVATAFWIAGGHELFSGNPSPTATSSELRIESFNSRVEQGSMRSTLMVDGTAVNDGLSSVVLPALEIQVVSGDGALTRYKLGTAGASLAAGDVFPFSGRLDLPKHGVKTVSVAFVE